MLREIAPLESSLFPQNNEKIELDKIFLMKSRNNCLTGGILAASLVRWWSGEFQNQPNVLERGKGIVNFFNGVFMLSSKPLRNGNGFVVSLSFGILACVSLGIAPGAGADIVVDDFSNDVTLAPDYDFTSVPIHGSMLGGERRVSLENLNGNGTVSAGVSGGALNMYPTTNAYPDLAAVWDGGTGVTGLGGLDITQGGANDRARFNVTCNGAFKIYLYLHEDVGLRSFVLINFNNPMVNQDVDVFFNDIGTDGGPGANFHNIGAISMDVTTFPDSGYATEVHINNFSFVPAPGAAALLGLGGLLSFRRRR